MPNKMKRNVLLVIIVVLVIVAVAGLVNYGRREKGREVDVSEPIDTTSGDARFTGNHAEAGVDSDEDGKYNFLSVEAEIEVVKSGNYGIYGFLMFDGKEITSRPFARSEVLSYSYLSSGPAIQTITLDFSGEDIYESGKSGHYTIDLKLIDDESGDCIDTVSFETTNFSYTEFGESQR